MLKAVNHSKITQQKCAKTQALAVAYFGTFWQNGRDITFLLLLLVALMVPFAPPLVAKQSPSATRETEPPKGLFGSIERFSSNADRFAKWRDMLQRFQVHETRLAKRAAERAAADAQATQPPSNAAQNSAGSRDINPRLAGTINNRTDSCGRRNRLTCNRQKWQRFVQENRNTQGMDLLNAVNGYMNRAPYIIDPVNWNLPDYWATPNEFFIKDGDCEDYAISKYVTLKRLGWPTENMRIVVLRDENLRIAHAVLAVEWNGETYILDNQADRVLPHTKILHYRPVYSINESGWWLHQKPRRF